MEREKRRKGKKSDSRQGALERLKAARAGGTVADYKVDDVENIFDEVDEAEYQKIKDSRAGAWMVDGDDDYYDDGREIFEDEDDQFVAEDAKKTKEVKKRNKFAVGTRNITSMFLQAKKKKKVTASVKINDDNDLDDLFKEIDDDSFSLGDKTKTPKQKKKVKKLSSVSCLSDRKTERTKKRVLTELPTQPTKKQKVERPKVEAISSDEDLAPPPCNDFDDDFDDVPDIIPSSQNTTQSINSAIEKITVTDIIAKPEVKVEPRVQNYKADEITATAEIDWNSSIKEAMELREEEESYDFSNDDKNLCFYWLDAHEAHWRRDGKLYLTGRVRKPEGGTQSCCIQIVNIPHVLYFLPRNDSELTEVYEEVDELFDVKKIKKFKSRKVSKKNFFGGPDVPEEAEYLRVEYDASYPTLDHYIKGRTFSRVFNIGQDVFEFFSLERTVKGPCWLSIAKYHQDTAPASWCKIEYITDDYKSVSVHEKNDSLPIPLLTLVSLSLQSIPRKSSNELVAISLLINDTFKMTSTKKTIGFNKNIHAISKPAGITLPYDWDGKKMKANQNLECCLNEKQLINFFLTQFRFIDPDIVLGHDLLEFGLEFLLQRIKLTGVGNWSRLGRIRRKEMPKMGLSVGQSRAGFHVATGRLVADIKLSSKELVKMRDYDLTALSKEHIPEQKDPQLTSYYQNRTEYLPDDVIKAFDSSKTLLSFCNEIRTDALRCLLIAAKIQAIPLALQITHICGNTMSRTLQGGRAERNSFLLLHAFHEKDHLPPDKRPPKRKGEKDGDKKKAKYAGGLVLEPKKGFYTNYILLLDFNSLYPSIIQEYNICFTTTEIHPPNESDTDWLPEVAPQQEPGILPIQIRNLVQKRRTVKQMMKGEKNEDELARLNIRQLGLKLTANSMYGCLGFSASRFYAQPLAALITSKGREILQHTKEFVERMSLEVVYGDTDSIMINSNSTVYKDVMELGNRVKKEINKHYKLLEIDIDGAYKSMLLLKKKKYAALAAEKHGDEIVTKEEFKGLDIVRRDWSNIARKVGTEILKMLLHDIDEDRAIEKIHDHLELVGNQIRANEFRLVDFIIHKALTKAPEAYPKKGDGQPHVLVALRLNKKVPGKYKAGDTVTYVICENSDDKMKATDRAYHPSEVAREKLKLDFGYYFRNQLIPVISRLLDPIECTDQQMIAERLGLDPKEFKSKSSERIKAEHEAEQAAIANQKEEDKLANCDPLEFQINGVNVVMDLWLPPYEQLVAEVPIRQHQAQIEVAINRAIRDKVRKFYQNWQLCDCGFRTRKVLTKYNSKGDFICPQCRENVLNVEYSFSDLYLQILYYQRLFNYEKWKQKLDSDMKAQGTDKKETIKQLTDLEVNQNFYAASRRLVSRAMARSNYNRVNLSSLFAPLSAYL